MLRGSAVLCLDEATAALDSVNEACMMAAVFAYVHNRDPIGVAGSGQEDSLQTGDGHARAPTSLQSPYQVKER